MAGVFKEAVLTAKGIALLAKAQAGRCTIKLTKAATGDGSYSDGEAPCSLRVMQKPPLYLSLSVVCSTLWERTAGVWIGCGCDDWL